MDEITQQLESYFDELVQRGEKVPSWRNTIRPNFKAISVAAGVKYQRLLSGPYKLQIILRSQEIGLIKNDTISSRQQAQFDLNCKLLNTYLSWLEEYRLQLPEDPNHKGRIYFAQLSIEAGLSRHSVTPKGKETGGSYVVQLRRMIEKKIPVLGMGVRVLPQSPRDIIPQMTYEELLARGTEQRRHQLKDKPSKRSQLDNTRYALNLFRKSLNLKKDDLVGKEFVVNFESSFEIVVSQIENLRSKKKFQTEIHRWVNFYQSLIKEASIPSGFHEALAFIINRSGLSMYVIAKLINMSDRTLRSWYHGTNSPSKLHVDEILRLEALFKLPTGALCNKISPGGLTKYIRFSMLPDFLKENPNFARKVKSHLPEDFCDLSLEKQVEIVNSIQADIFRGDDVFLQRLRKLMHLPYALKEWPEQLHQEFQTFAHFKMDIRPPLGMKRNGKWRATTRDKQRSDLSYLFGAVSLPTDSKDIRVRGLGMSETQLTLALIACPLLIDWFIRFRFEVRNNYSEYAINMLSIFISMLRPETGWLRQNPQLASRLSIVKLGDMEVISPNLITRAHEYWDGVCDDAFRYYKHLVKELKPISCVSRNPFAPIEGILNWDIPLMVVDFLLREMRSNLPNPHTQPVRYHKAIRDCVLVLLLGVTGLRRNTIVQLNYTGDIEGHLNFIDDEYVLNIPRALFKNEESAYFGSPNAKKDYVNQLPNVCGLNELFKEYLTVSRPFLLNKCHQSCREHPLFVNSTAKSSRLAQYQVTRIYTEVTRRYLAENKWRGTGIAKVQPHGPHSVRHIRGTTGIKLTGSTRIAGDAIHVSEHTAQTYARYMPEDRNKRVNEILFGNW